MFKKLILAVLCAALVLCSVPAAFAAEQPGLSLAPVYEDGNVIRVEASLEEGQSVDYAQFTFTVSDGYAIQAGSCEKVAQGDYSVYSSLKSGVLTVTLEKSAAGFAGLTSADGVVFAFDIQGSGSVPVLTAEGILCYIDGTDSEWSASATMAAAQVGDTAYGTLTEALAAGGTVVLHSDISVETLRVPAGVTLDLNGKNLTAENVLCFGTLVDGESGGVGGITVSNDTTQAVVILQPGNPQLPIYDTENGCYRLYAYEMSSLGAYKLTDSAAKFGFRLLLDNAAGYDLLQGTTASGMTLTVKLEVPGMEAVDITYVYQADTVKTYAGYASRQMADGGTVKTALTLTVSGMDKLTTGQSVQATFLAGTGTGVSGGAAPASWTVQ